MDEQKVRDLHERILKQKGYEYVSILGKGGFSVVITVFSPKYQQNFACKITELDQYAVEPDMAEVDALRTLDNPHIISLYDHFRIGRFFYVVLQHCENGNVQDLVGVNGRFPFRVALKYLREVAVALAQCHASGIAHRDIKPSNILIDSYGRAILADFGLGIKLNENELAKTGVCSIAYSPPEQFKKKQIDPFKADMWSLGVTLYYMVCGKVPWKGTSRDAMVKEIGLGLQSLNAGLPRGIKNVLMNLVRIEPAQRWTAAQLLEDEFLQKYCTAPAPIPISVDTSLISKLSPRRSLPMVTALTGSATATPKSFQLVRTKHTSGPNVKLLTGANRAAIQIPVVKPKPVVL